MKDFQNPPSLMGLEILYREGGFRISPLCVHEFQTKVQRPQRDQPQIFEISLPSLHPKVLETPMSSTPCG